MAAKTLEQYQKEFHFVQDVSLRQNMNESVRGIGDSWTGRDLPFMNDPQLTFATTGDYADIAKNHCGAVTATNLVMILGTDASAAISDAHRRKLFVELHRRIGNGPIFSLDRKLKRYYADQGLTLTSHRLKSFDEVCSEIDKGHPCLIMLAAGPVNWHWVTITGWRIHIMPDGSVRRYYRIADSWHRKLMHLHEAGSVCVLSLRAYSLQ